MIKTITGAFKRLTLHRAVERDQQAALDRFDQIKWEEYEAAKAALWRKLELQYLKDVNTLQHEMLHDEPIDRGIMLDPDTMEITDEMAAKMVRRGDRV